MKKRFSLGFVSLLLVLIVLAVVFRYLHSRPRGPLHVTPISVVTAKAHLMQAPLFIKAQGSVEASRSVAVQPQATGVIKKIGFTPGQAVKAGQLLFQLDAVTYQAALSKVQASLLKDRAQLDMTKKDKARYETLVKKGYVSQQQYDQTLAQLAEELSTIKLDKAAVEQTQAELAYTKILAPIAGKTGNVTVKQGDLVSAASNTTLVTINQLSPVFVNFYLPQNELSLLIKYAKQHSLQAEVYGSGNKERLEVGKVTFIDNVVNPNTGTILLKATMPNKQHILWPGESVVVRLIFTIEKNVLTIPSQAVQTDQQGNFVYLIQKQQAHITPITVLRQVGQLTFVSRGLKPGDEVATVFPPGLNDGTPVVVQTAREAK